MFDGLQPARSSGIRSMVSSARAERHGRAARPAAASDKRTAVAVAARRNAFPPDGPRAGIVATSNIAKKGGDPARLGVLAGPRPLAALATGLADEPDPLELHLAVD